MENIMQFFIDKQIEESYKVKHKMFENEEITKLNANAKIMN